MEGLKLIMLTGLIYSDQVVVSYDGSDAELLNKQYEGPQLSICGCGSWLEFNNGLCNIPEELANKVVKSVECEVGTGFASDTMFELAEQVQQQYPNNTEFEHDSCMVKLEGIHYQHITQGDSLQIGRIVITVTD